MEKIRDNIVESDKTKEKKVGRPSKYSFEMLKKILLEYAEENVGGEITISKLVKYSGLPIQAWRFNAEIRKEIEKQNAGQIINFTGAKDIGLPSAEDLINKNYKNKDRLTKVVSDLIEVCQDSYAEIAKLRKYKEKLDKTKNELELTKAEVQKYRKEAEFYKNEMLKVTLKSTTAIGRAEACIENNVIDLKQYTETSTTFSDLFDD